MAETQVIKQDELDLGLEATVSVAMEARAGGASRYAAGRGGGGDEVGHGSRSPGPACVGAQGCGNDAP